LSLDLEVDRAQAVPPFRILDQVGDAHLAQPAKERLEMRAHGHGAGEVASTKCRQERIGPHQGRHQVGHDLAVERRAGDRCRERSLPVQGDAAPHDLEPLRDLSGVRLRLVGAVERQRIEEPRQLDFALGGVPDAVLGE
jgi:hypothetical protein